ncbi:MAG: hypothetical protein E6J34_03065 [Chloroflexi bacterium]|nr:MAG: hypothetical protein E6J34_03065 [Chloroflexota bacterium]
MLEGNHMAQHTSQPEKKQGLLRSYLAHRVSLQKTAKIPMPTSLLPKKDAPMLPVISIPDDEPASSYTTTGATMDAVEHLPLSAPQAAPRGALFVRVIAAILVLILLGALYYIWRADAPPSMATAVTPQNASSATATLSNNPNTQNSTKGTIEVYIVGAVKRPGVYVLAASARVYELLQVAGGPLPNANLVALNLAARLSDGQEVYVPLVGEQLPTYQGGVPGSGSATAGTTITDSLVNINTASAQEMQKMLHISSTTAQNILNYRTQHGSFTSIDQLLQVVSKTIYDKIKDSVAI